MWAYIYGLTAAFTVGFHIFSFKLLSLYKEHYYAIIFFSLITLILSRIFIYLAMRSVSNPAIVHICLNTSIFVTLFLSIMVLGIKGFHIGLFTLGILFTILGFSCIQYSYQLNMTVK